MGQAPRLIWVLSAVIGLTLPTAVLSQDLRPPESWLNTTSNDRLPIRERKLEFPEDTTAPKPPAPKRSGWTPRLSFALETQDRDVADNTRATLTPGLSFESASERAFAAADLSFEMTENFDVSGLSSGFANPQAQGLFSYTLTERTRLSAFGGLSRLTDGTQQALTGFVPRDTETEQVNVSGSLEHRLTDRFDIQVDLGATWQSSDQANVFDVDTTDFDVTFGALVNEITRVEAHLRYLAADFSGNRDAELWEADITYLRRASPRLSYSASIGAQLADGVTSTEHLKVGAEANFTTRNAIYTLDAGSDVVGVIGLTNLVRIEQIAASGHWRLGRGWQLQAGLERQWLEELNLAKTNTTLTEANLGISYAIQRNTWAWIRAILAESETGGTTSRDNRISIGLTQTFN